MKRLVPGFAGLLTSLIVITAVITAIGNARAQSISTPAAHAILIEVETGEILFEQEAEVPFPPASMSKMMTTYVAFEMIKMGVFGLDDTTQISEEVWRQWRGRGSTMFLNAGDEVTIGDLLRGIIVQSGNDACVALAEAMAGSEAAFVEWMNIKADELGMSGSHFTNTNGWPDEGQVVTAHDLGLLASHLVADFPELYKIYSETSFTYGIDPSSGRPITQRNRNPILGRVEGADGLKTGHTDESGYGLVASAMRDGRRLVLVISGLDSERARSREAQRLLEYGFRNFKTYELFNAGQRVAEGNVWLGNKARIGFIAEQDVAVTMSRFDRNRMTVTLVYDDPIAAPIAAGQVIAHVRVSAPNRDDLIIPLVAADNVENMTGFDKLSAAFNYLLFGSSGN
jgi:serine-type D-Ala-D-Ala carboxypeptidase (penicillin-binding protein 5/6)